MPTKMSRNRNITHEVGTIRKAQPQWETVWWLLREFGILLPQARKLHPSVNIHELTQLGVDVYGDLTHSFQNSEATKTPFREKPRPTETCEYSSEYEERN